MAQMFRVVPLVSGVFTLVAFVVAVVAATLWTYWRHQENLVKDAGASDQEDLVLAVLDRFSVPIHDLSSPKRYDLALRLLTQRTERFRIVAIIVALVTILAFVLALRSTMSREGNGTSGSSLAREQVLKLKREILGVRGTWESIDDLGEPARRKVAILASPLGDDMSRVGNGLLKVGTVIEKYTYAMYAYLMAADVACDSQKSRLFGDKAISSGKKALEVMRTSTSKAATTNYQVNLREWLREEGVSDRAHFLLALSYSVQARLGDVGSEEQVREHIDNLSDEFRREYSVETNRLLGPVLCLSAERECPEIATGPFPCEQI